MTFMLKNEPYNTPQCPQSEICSGCQYLHFSYEKQENLKVLHLQDLLTKSGLEYTSDFGFFSAGAGALRDRLDFSLENNNLGLYHKTNREVLDLDFCAQLSPELMSWLTDFRKFKFSVQKGSIRLRVSPEGQRGVWLDFANIDIKNLLEEKETLHNLQKMAFVEIGQRRKIPVWTGQEFKLKDPQLQHWFNTWVEDTPVKLHCHVAGFTQPSHKANKIIANMISHWVKNHPEARLIEFGSGIGNLTLPAAATASSLLACEIDALSLEGLEKTLQSLPPELADLKNKVTIHRGDFQKKLKSDFSQFDGILANPPRSGLMNFLNPLEELEESQRPEFFIYMSCFPESMMEDVKRLKLLGYTIQELNIVDQFPQTKHYEVLGLLQRK